MEKTEREFRYLSDCPEHIDLLTAWLNAAFDISHDAEAFARRRERLVSYARSADIPFTRVLLEDGVPIGTCSLLAHDLFGFEERYPLTPWVASLYVVPERRGLGLGDSILDDTLAIARERGFPSIYLWAEDALVPYYRERGWNVIESLIYRKKTATIMEKTLP